MLAIASLSHCKDEGALLCAREVCFFVKGWFYKPACGRVTFLSAFPNERIFEVMILDQIHTLSLWNCYVADNG